MTTPAWDWHTIWTALAGAVGGGGITQLAAFLNERAKGRAYTMGAVDHAVETALSSVTQEVERLNKQVVELREQARVEHEDCQLQLKGIRSEAQSAKAEAERLRGEIDQLMRGRVANYPVAGGI